MTIRGIQVHEDVLTTRFACDYKVCKGFCCHPVIEKVGFSGCTLTPEEEKSLLRDKKILMENVPDDRKSMFKYGEFLEYNDKDVASVAGVGPMCCLEHNGCILNKLYAEGKLPYKNPISCALYPLYYNEGQKFLFITDYYQNGVCDCGYEKGERENIHIVDFLKEALIRKFGQKFYDELRQHIK